MGCDIHLFIERRGTGERPTQPPEFEGWSGLLIPPRDVDPSAPWWELVDEADCDRSYGLFGWLAGVRNYSALTPLSEPRGFPADASHALRATYEEYGGNAHTPSWFTAAELIAVDYDQVVEDRRVTRRMGEGWLDGGQTCDVGEGKQVKLRDFLPASFMQGLDYLRTDPENLRIVFWFDN